MVNKVSTGIFVLLLVVGLSCGCVRKRGADAPVTRETSDALTKAIGAYDAGEFAKSMEAFGAAVKDTGGADARSYNGRGVLLLRAGQYARAQTDFESALLLDAGTVQYRYNLALAHFAQGNTQNAEQLLDEVLRVAPEFGPAYLAKGAVALGKGDPRTAMIHLDRAVSLMPNEFGPFYNRGIARMQSGLYDDAERDFSRCISLEPKHDGAFNNRGLCRFYAGKLAEAVADFTDALALKPDNFDYFFNRGLAFKGLFEYKKSVDDFTHTIAYGPGKADAYVWRGEVLFLLEKDEAGCADLRSACELGDCLALERYEESGRCGGQ